MPVTGHPGTGLQERRFNAGLATLPSGRSPFPAPRRCEFHRTIGQRLPELWADFSDKAVHQGRAGVDSNLLSFHGDHPHEQDMGLTQKSPGLQATGSMTLKSKSPPKAPIPGSVVFVGYAEFDMDGRTFTAGEMDRLMMHSAVSKYPCARPATFDEYTDQAIVGLPKKNASGRDIVFVGPGGTGCELYHTNTLGSQKCAVPPGEALDGTWGLASMYGRKSVLCVYPVERVKRQQSLTQFGLCRATLDVRGRMKPSQSLTTLTDKTMWVSTGFARSTSEAQSTCRMDQFFR
jgi:hypothetical protein